MDPISRRNLLGATAAGGLLTAAAVAGAQTGPVPQPQRPGRGGTDHGPRNLTLDRQNPDILVPPSTDLLMAFLFWFYRRKKYASLVAT